MAGGGRRRRCSPHKAPRTGDVALPPARLGRGGRRPRAGHAGRPRRSAPCRAAPAAGRRRRPYGGRPGTELARSAPGEAEALRRPRYGGRAGPRPSRSSLARRRPLAAAGRGAAVGRAGQLKRVGVDCTNGVQQTGARIAEGASWGRSRFVLASLVLQLPGLPRAVPRRARGAEPTRCPRAGRNHRGRREAPR